MDDGEHAEHGSGMTDAETAEHLRRAVDRPSGTFAWETDGCGYDQHIRFVEHRNKNWYGGTQQDWRAFVLAYADGLAPAPPTEEGE